MIAPAIPRATSGSTRRLPDASVTIPRQDGRERHEGIPEIVDVGEADLRLLNTVGGFADHLVDPARLRQHRDVASR
jgi:hypothetical protein